MSLFGLVLLELAVVCGIGILILGLSKVVGRGRDLGRVSGSVKTASSEFQETMGESNSEADAETVRRLRGDMR